jgi:hypothetical protein
MVSCHLQAAAGVNSIKTFARQSTEVFSNVRWHEAIYFRVTRDTVRMPLRNLFLKTCWGESRFSAKRRRCSKQSAA